jgi:excisionase family DNA binding protein
MEKLLAAPVPMSVQETAKYLSKHPEVIRRWIRAGKIRAYQPVKCGTFIIYKHQLDEDLASCQYKTEAV